MMVTEFNNVMDRNGYSKTQDAEIKAYTEIIKDTNEKKMPEIKNTSMLNFAPNNLPPKPIEHRKSEDWNSVKGQFGWIEIKKKVIPYLIRSGRKYVSQQLADMKLFNSFQLIFTNEVFDCYRINASPATKTEAALLNEINFRHCDNYYGSHSFVEGCPLHCLEDVVEKLEFLEFCHERLIRQKASNFTRCGFVNIDNENCVPYVCINGKTYVPLFYFEVESNYLEKQSVDLEGWDLTYLRFACKIQDIRKDLFNRHKVPVVELGLAKTLFLHGTTFVKCWQFENKVNHLIKETVDVMDSLINQKPSQNYIQKQPIHNLVTSTKYQQNTSLNLSTQNQQKSNYQNIYNNYVNWRNTKASSNTVKTTNIFYPPIDTKNTGTTQSLLKVIQNTSMHRFRKQHNSERWFHKDSNAYGLFRIQIENQFLNYCVNSEPYEGNLLLVTLEEVALIFLKASIESTWNAVIGAHLHIHQPNYQQLRVLQKFNIMSTRGMIRTDTLRDNLLLLKYILHSSRVITNANNPG